MLSLIPRDVLGEIGDLIEPVSEAFPTCSCQKYMMTLYLNSKN